MANIKRIFTLILFIICIAMIANAQSKSYRCENNTYSSTGRVAGKTAPALTPYFWSDSKGNKYPIYMSSNGSCFIIKHRKYDNKEYKDYLGKEISIEICKKLGKEYKGKK